MALAQTTEQPSWTSDDPEVQALMEGMQRQNELAEEISRKYPGLPHITTVVMAGDVLSAQRAREMLEKGEWTATQALALTGSYARFEFALELVNEGRLTREWLYENLPELWRGSDPDDTEPRYLALWYAAWRANGYHPVNDGRTLPRSRVLTIYRGQMPNDPLGMAWTLNPKIAAKFAGGAGLRTEVKGGIIVRAEVARSQVLAYMTGRGEAEIIVDPNTVRLVGGFGR